ncbi:hypothetical protein [Mesobacillus zeae]|uniref:Uncharacterized protein n=1 Tax=Mesobacillus zeae TaxID=1917180 RepID=A0A398B3I7_9BACI|nr:hypothetical protein [Mesobacillus zeae]RID84435.1 hypothetical protein D1970_12950 [Mesobacillus zeae]
MLKVKIKGLPPEKITSKFISGEHIIYRGKSLASIIPGHDSTVFLIDSRLELNEYQLLRDIIVNMTEGTTSQIDDSECQLGYLENGDKAFLLENWEEWKTFLMGAKLRTLEGQNVLVKNEDGKDLGSGLLAGYTSEKIPFRITGCTLITASGEKTFTGNSLEFEPISRF